MTWLLEVDVERKAFAGRQVLDRIEIGIKAGEVVTLVGPSGCGKSTLLRIVAGLDRDYRGSLQLQGQALLGLNRNVGFVFQEPRLFPWLSVAENVGFSAGAAGATDGRTRELVAAVGLADFASALPKALSGGMMQRAAIARGLFTQPRLLLLDEPFSAVDAFTRMKLQDLLLALAAQRGTTLLSVTHDIDEAVYLSDRVLVMSSGPGMISAEARITVPRPRDRRDPRLAEFKAEVLTHLYDVHAI